MSGPIAELNSLIESAQPAALPELIGHLAAMQARAQLRLMSENRSETESGLLTVPEVAKRLKVSEYKVYELIRQGKIKKTPIGDSVRVTPDDLAEYLKRQRA